MVRENIALVLRKNVDFGVNMSAGVGDVQCTFALSRCEDAEAWCGCGIGGNFAGLGEQLVREKLLSPPCRFANDRLSQKD